MGKPTKYDFSGWATKYNLKCSDGRTILHNAFKDKDGAKVPLVWNHNHDGQQAVLGNAILEHRDEGVYAYGSFNETEEGKRAKELVQHGDIVALSIYANQLKQNNNKEVIHGNIRELSLVLAGANPGAYIETVIAHSDDLDEEAIIHMYDDSQETNLEMYHAEKNEEEQKSEEQKKASEKTVKEVYEEMTEEQQAVINILVDFAVQATLNGDEEAKHALDLESIDHAEKGNESEKTLKEIFDEMTEEQKNVAYLLIGAAVEKAKAGELDGSKENDSEEGGKDTMKHNVFEGITNNEGQELTHNEFVAILEDAKKNGSIKDAFLSHGFTDIGNLFPEAQSANKEPVLVSRDMSWVAKVMAAVKHTPFSKVKSTYATCTADEARARGFVKGNKKVEEVLAAFKRSTTPQTIYKLQKMDRDDVIDITDFDVVAWIKKEMRMMLDEELARAILIGDGRSSSSDDKINPLNIRPVYGDDSTYTVKRILTRAAGATDEAFAKAFIKDVVRSRKEYKGSGNPVLYTTEDMLTNMLLIEDKNERVIYDTVEKLKTALRVSDIVTVEVMEGVTRTAGSDKFGLLGVLVNLADYNVGADKGGAVSMFEDFDINYNKQEYLIETRCSGALVRPYSAITFEEKLAEEAQG